MTVCDRSRVSHIFSSNRAVDCEIFMSRALWRRTTAIQSRWRPRECSLAPNGGGNGLAPFPRPPLFLQKLGRNQRTQGDSSGDGSSRQTIDRTQVGPEVGHHQIVVKTCQLEFDSRRLHYFSNRRPCRDPGTKPFAADLVI